MFGLSIRQQILIGFLVGLIISACSLIPTEFYEYLTDLLTHKLVWILLLSTVIALLIKFDYFFTKEKSTSDNSLFKKDNKLSKKEQQKIISNLSADDKSKLFQYFQRKTKSLVLKRDGTLIHLVDNGILYCPFKPKEFTNEDTFVMNDWAWRYIIKNKKKLGMNL